MRNRGQSPPLLLILFAALLAAGGAAFGAENIDPAGDGHQYAWGENVGWVNVEPSDDGGSGVEVTDFKLTGWMWGENIGWINVSCENTSVCGDTDFGVLNDGSGHLSGFAWSENAGWINFCPRHLPARPDLRGQDRSRDGLFHGKGLGREHRLDLLLLREPGGVDGADLVVPGIVGAARTRGGAHGRQLGARPVPVLDPAVRRFLVRRRRGNAFGPAGEPRGLLLRDRPVHRRPAVRDLVPASPVAADRR